MALRAERRVVPYIGENLNANVEQLITPDTCEKVSELRKPSKRNTIINFLNDFPEKLALIVCEHVHSFLIFSLRHL